MLAFLFLALVSLASPLYALRCNGGMYYYTPNVTIDYETNLYGVYFAESNPKSSALSLSPLSLFAVVLISAASLLA